MSRNIGWCEFTEHRWAFLFRPRKKFLRTCKHCRVTQVRTLTGKWVNL